MNDNPIYCGILAGPNSTCLLNIIIPIAEQLSINKIEWIIHKDTKSKYNIKNNFSFLESKSNVTFIGDVTINVESGGDRAGYGWDRIIRYLHDKDKIILMEPDIFPVKHGWDIFLLSKINLKKNIILHCPTYNEKYYDTNFNINYEKKYLSRGKSAVGIIFLALNPKSFIDIGCTFMRQYLPNWSKIPNNIEQKLFKNYHIDSRYFTIKNKIDAEINDVPINTVLEKDTGWRVPYYLKNNNLHYSNFNSFKYIYDINDPEIIKLDKEKNKKTLGYIDLLFDDTNNLFAIHVRHSRFMSEYGIKVFSNIIKRVLNYFQIKDIF